MVQVPLFDQQLSWRRQISQQLATQLQLSYSLALPESQIPLYQLNFSEQIIYRSSVPRLLANLLRVEPEAIALQLCQDLLTQLDSPWKIILSPGGTIDWQLSLPALATWLNHLASCLIKPLPPQQHAEPVQIVSPYFPLQYSHARCCSLLRLAQQQGLLTNQWYLSPWSAIFPLFQKEDRFLIQGLVTFVDQFPAQPLALAQNLSQKFLNLERHCRLWTELVVLCQGRLNLIALTQNCLQVLLLEHLKITAPQEM